MAVSDECFRTVDVWLDIGKDFAMLKGMIMAGKEYKDMVNVFGDIGLIASYGYSKELVSKEEVEIAKYHRERIRNSLENKVAAMGNAESAVTWAGRTFADKVADCECQRR